MLSRPRTPFPVCGRVSELGASSSTDLLSAFHTDHNYNMHNMQAIYSCSDPLRSPSTSPNRLTFPLKTPSVKCPNFTATYGQLP
jgi:hypothetical protein